MFPERNRHRSRRVRASSCLFFAKSIACGFFMQLDTELRHFSSTNLSKRPFSSVFISEQDLSGPFLNPHPRHQLPIPTGVLKLRHVMVRDRPLTRPQHRTRIRIPRNTMLTFRPNTPYPSATPQPRVVPGRKLPRPRRRQGRDELANLPEHVRIRPSPSSH